MALITPEALLIPKTNPLDRLRPLPPITATGNAAIALSIYDESKEIVCDSIVLQNLSTTAVKVAWNQACSEESFHEVLAACSAQDDGLGGNTTIQVKVFGMRSVSLWCGGAAIRCLVTKFQRGTGAKQI